MDNSKTTRSDAPLSRALLIEAAAWLARMNGPLRTEATEQGFAQWLKDDPRHREAFTEVSRDWERTEDLKAHAHVLISARPEAALKVNSRRAAGGPWLALAAALVLAVAGGGWWHLTRSTGLATDIGEQRILRLNDGTKVFLNTATHMVVDYDERTRRVRLDAGEALFEVAQEAKRPFVVSAGDREVTALGTAFLVRRDPDRLAVTLMEGKVSVASSSNTAEQASAPTVLSPGERVIFKRAIGTPQVDRPSLPQLVAWQQGQVLIDNSPLSEAVAEMNRYSPIKLVIERPETAAMPLSGMFAAGQSMSFARAVAETYHLEVIDQGSTIVLSGIAQRSLPPE